MTCGHKAVKTILHLEQKDKKKTTNKPQKKKEDGCISH